MLHRGDLVIVKKEVFSYGTVSPKVGKPYEYHHYYVDKGQQIAVLIDLDTEQEYHIPIRFVLKV